MRRGFTLVEVLVTTGIIELTEAGKRMTKNLEEYFTSRREDDV